MSINDAAAELGLSRADRPTRVTLAYIHPEVAEGAFRFMDSVVGLLLHDARTHQYLTGNGGGSIGLTSSTRVAEARSQVVDEYLSNPVHRRSDWLLFIDADMVFDPDLLDQLLSWADPVKVPVLGGLCFAGRFDGNQWPTVYRAYNEGEDQHLAFEPVDELPESALVKVGATGAACLLIHRWVLKAMLKQWGTLPDGRPNPYPWFAEGLTTSRGIPLGEDIAFCRRLMLMQIPVHVHTGIRLGHVKPSMLTWESWQASREGVPA